MEKEKKKKNHILAKILLVLVLMFAAFMIWVMVSSPNYTATGYPSVDLKQATEQKCGEIAEFMDGYLEEEGYFVLGYSVHWVGYSHFSDTYSLDEYQEMALGGYYSYTGNLSTGETATANVRTYWEDGESPVVVNLTVETITEENQIIPYSEDKMDECWDIYNQKAYPEK